MAFVQVLKSGGIVMVPLIVFSMAVIALSIERIRFWSRVSRRQRPIVKQFLQKYRADPILATEQLKRHSDLPIPRIFLEALSLEGASLNQFGLALESATQAEVPLLKRFNTIFQTIISVAPLLGLLGTILGLIRSFASIRLGEIGSDASGVTGGIGEALVSTAMGMSVAIVALIFANLFRGLYRRQIAMVQEYGSQLEILYEGHQRRVIHQQPSPEEPYAQNIG
ncbi:MAG: MotA/TolQ/ExbB proton channel family protein [Cyanobacteria bacterium P01_H01_bin.15]